MNDITNFENNDYLGKDKISHIQYSLLKTHLDYCIGNSPFYRERLKTFQMDSFSYNSFITLPFTNKSDLEKYNKEFLSVPEKKIIDIVYSSGTMGEITQIMYTEHDLKRLAYNEQRALTLTGITADDIVLLTCTMDRCFVAGLAYFLGLRNIGASVIRNGINSVESHAQIIKRAKPNVIIGVPTFLKKLGLYLKENAEYKDCLSTVNKLICIGEPLKNINMKPIYLSDALKEIWQAKTFSTYASTEMITSFCECEMQQGGHLLPELLFVEIINEEGNVLKDGEVGEVVVTPFAIEGMPLIRFKTGDISFINSAPCPCGRNTPRLGPIIGRKNQMMKVNGTTIYPQAIFSVMDEFDFIIDYYIEVSCKHELSDEIQVYVALKENSNNIEKTIINKLQARLRFTPTVSICSKDTVLIKVFQKKIRKPIRFFDNR